jgi:hypothetical protein
MAQPAKDIPTNQPTGHRPNQSLFGTKRATMIYTRRVDVSIATKNQPFSQGGLGGCLFLIATGMRLD